MSVATTDGDRLWVFRYSSEGKSSSLFYSTAVETLRAPIPGPSRAAHAIRGVAVGRLGAA